MDMPAHKHKRITSRREPKSKLKRYQEEHMSEQIKIQQGLMALHELLEEEAQPSAAKLPLKIQARFDNYADLTAKILS